MSNTVQLPAAQLTLSAIAPTVNVSSDNTVRLPAALLSLTAIAPEVTAGQQNMRYTGRMSIRTRTSNTLG